MMFEPILEFNYISESWISSWILGVKILNSHQVYTTAKYETKDQETSLKPLQYLIKTGWNYYWRVF